MLTIQTVPAFDDNYLWVFHAAGSSRAYVVDPGDARPIETALERSRLELAGILVTHHHGDHIGGINALLAARPKETIAVYGPHSPNIPQITHPLTQGQTLELDDGIRFEVLEVPGHTLDHIAYYNHDDAVLFCGDTLFAGGCGRMFEGNPAQMQASLEKLSQLPGNTLVYCAHEYTESNLRFALAVEPDNTELIARAASTSILRQSNQATVPSRLSDELATNPFVRVHEAPVIAAASRYCAAELSGPAEVFAQLRGWKDHF